MREIIEAKLNWSLNYEEVLKTVYKIEESISKRFDTYPEAAIHPLLKTLYTNENLKYLYITKDFLQKKTHDKVYLFLKLALSQTLHKCSIYPISVPYISRANKLKGSYNSLVVFKETVNKMLGDLQELRNYKRTSQVFLHDSRKYNKNIETDLCDVCVTSPPYLNNLDYGEVSKVHTHFFGVTESWNDITEKVRKNLVTAATTHYAGNDYNEQEWKESEFCEINKKVAQQLSHYSDSIRDSRIAKGGSKSFDIMLKFYFRDMFYVLKEMRRILHGKGKAFIILGDSAPYGVFVPTTDILGEISLNLGFKKYEKHKIRTRGTKWQSLTHRHKLHLDENILVLR